MSIIEQIERGEAQVTFTRSSDGTLKISPLDKTEASYEMFQEIADEAIAEAYAEGRYVLPHTSDRTGRSSYDVVVIGPIGSG